VKKILIFLLPLLVWSCDSRKIVFEEEVVLGNHWSYDQQLDFSFEVPDTLAAYDLILEIEHDKEYPFQNFYTQFITSYPGGKVVKDLVSMELADTYGQWKGDCGRETCVAEILLSSNSLFKNMETHRIQIEQYTRTPLLSGIEKFRFLLIQK